MQANPGLKVVGEASAQHLRPYLPETARVKLSQTQLGSDPPVTELCHPAMTAVWGLRLVLGHLLLKSKDRCTFFQAQDRTAALLIFRAPLRLARKALAILHPGSIAVPRQARLFLVSGVVAQKLAFWTNGTVSFVVVDKRTWRKAVRCARSVNGFLAGDATRSAVLIDCFLSSSRDRFLSNWL